VPIVGSGRVPTILDSAASVNLELSQEELALLDRWDVADASN
jgi:hypothetical protein